MTEIQLFFVVSTQFNNLLPEQNPTRYSDEQILDLSRFDAAPLIAFTVTKETDYGTENTENQFFWCWRNTNVLYLS